MSAIEIMRSIGRPIAYRPALARHVGGVNAAIFLCQLIYWDERADSGDLGVYKTAEEWELETGLSYREQAGARKKLRELGLLTETSQRLQHRIYYKLEHAAFDALMSSISDARDETRESPDVHFANDENAIGELPKAQFADDPKRSSTNDENATRHIYRDYTETTTENISSTPRSADCCFDDFWAAYPNTPRRVAKAKCRALWKSKKLDEVGEDIIEHVRKMSTTRQWQDGYEPAPLTYLNQRRWEDGLPSSSTTGRSQPLSGNHKSSAFEQGMAAAQRAKAMIFGDDHAG